MMQFASPSSYNTLIRNKDCCFMADVGDVGMYLGAANS